MQRKDPSPGEPEAGAASLTPAQDAGRPVPGEDKSTRSRRRFGEGETTIMRLDELLKARPEAGEAPESGGEKTQVVNLAEFQQHLARQTERTIQAANLSDSQVALLQRTEPRASDAHTQSGRSAAAPAKTQVQAHASVWEAAPQAADAPAPAPPAAAAPATSAPLPARAAARAQPPGSGRTGGQLEHDVDQPPGVATRIGPLPSALHGRSIVPPPPPPPASAGSAATTAPPRIPQSPPQLPTQRPFERPFERATQKQAQDGTGVEVTQAGAEKSRPQPPRPPAQAHSGPTDPGRPNPLLAEPSRAAGKLSATADAALIEVQKSSVQLPATGIKRRVNNQVVVVFSCKGGAGATALAANTARAAVLQQQSACVVDLDLQLGDALAAFGLTPRFSLAQAIHLLSERQQLSRSLLPSHSSGVHVLSQVGNLNDLEKITPESVATLLLAMRQQFETILIDGVRDFSDNALAVLDGADKVAIVCVQEVLAIRRARWTFSILRKIGFAAEDITLVVNRAAAEGEIPLGSMASMFEGAQVVPLTGDTKLVTQSLNRGVPLAEIRPEHPLVQEFDRFSGHVFFDDAWAAAQAPQAPVKEGQKSFLKRMFAGKGARDPA